ncbi:hypothetical protein Q5H92_14745 [Hymenobacter sp. M29]|uniref:Uncharacterized protein n=1 Tax=Hymenobacter mellowenesis TaxID=3063995 RepID=A0ABT9AE25_9BACT|nr:hypothetical protein [Hymenobacter sp. M29]MDO7847624.1 hypothetical protein [Hymenobacter sp. M29]
MATPVSRAYVGSGTNAGSITSPTAGDIYLVDQTGTRLTTAAGGAAATGIRVISAVNAGTTPVAIPSQLITRSDIARAGVGAFTEQAYNAPVQQVDTVDFSNFAAGDQVSIRVEYKVNRKLQQGRDSVSLFNHTFAAGSTLTAEIDKIVAKINSTGIIGQAPAVAAKYITASNGGGTTLVLTGKTPPSTGSVLDTPDFTSFRTFVTELVPSGSFGQGQAYTVTNTTKPDPGQGTAAQVLFEEQYESGAYGRTDPRSFDRGQSTLITSAANTYSYIRLTPLKRIAGDLEGFKEVAQRVSLMLPVGSAQLTEAQTVIRAFVAGTATTPPAGE